MVPVVAGTVGMSYRRLVSWGAVGAVAWSMLYVGIGAAAGASWRLYGDRIGLAGLAVFGAALAILLVVRPARRGPGRPDHRVGPRPSARSQPERVHADARQKDRAELPIAARDERHHTAA
jgi:membrane-associated protein